MSDKSELMVKAEQILIDMIDKAAEIGSAAVDEIPLVVQELLTYNFVISLFFFLFWTLFSVVGWYSFYRFMVWGLQKEDGWNRSKIYNKDLELLVVIAPIILLIITFVPLAFTDWIKIWLAPRVYLLEYAASLVK